MFKKLFLMIASFKNASSKEADMTMQKVMSIDSFDELPPSVDQLDADFDQMLRELAKR